MGRVIRYVSQEKKTMDETGRRYLSGINCTPERTVYGLWVYALKTRSRSASDAAVTKLNSNIWDWMRLKVMTSDRKSVV